MQLDPTTARRLAATLVASVAVLVVAAPAQAEPDIYGGVAVTESDAFMRALRNEQYRADRTGIPNSVVPYLSHGMLQAEPKVVSYLSHGVGITRSDSGLFRLHSDRTQPAYTRPGVGAGGGFDWETAGIAAGVAGFAALLALSAMLASRRQRRLQGA